MCRFTSYLGPSIRLSSLLIDPEHSLIRQSSHSRERQEPLNGDGFGVGWYAASFANEPAVFRSITPAWNNRNLHNLSHVVASNCIFAHVRAATQSSSVNEANCHPFQYRQYLFMHNGDIGDFRKIRRLLLAGICDEAYGNIYGSTDSEHFFAVFIDEILSAKKGLSQIEMMADALDAAIRRTLECSKAYGNGEPSHMNFAVSDGDHIVISRFANDAEAPPPTLYHFQGALYPNAVVGNSGEHPADAAVIVSSERLSDDDGWSICPPNHLVLLERGRSPRFRSLEALLR